MNQFIKISVLFSFLFLMACEEQCIKIPEAPTPPGGRIMLLEDYTGVNCVPCFGANILIESVLDANPNSIVTFGIHGDLQSEPVSGSTFDFRYPDPFEWETNANIIGKPAGSFNRVTLPNGTKVKSGTNTWQGFIDTELQRAQVAEIKMLSDYDPTSRTTDIDISVIPLEFISGEVYVHVVISESHLIDSQNSPAEPPNNIVLDYEHNHVMKSSLTGLTGAFLASDLQPDEIYRYRVSYTVPDEVNLEWIPENMEITAFVTAADRDGEVQQAFQIHLTD